MVRALPHGSDTRIDIGRIAAIAAAIALHAAALLMLLMPMAAPTIAPTAKPKPIVHWYDREKPKPLDPMPVVQERKITPEKKPDAVQTRPDVAKPLVDTSVIVEGGTEATVIDAVEPAADLAGPISSGGPLPSATLEYVRATSPRYPINELRNGVQGTVILRVLVDIDGKPADVTVETSSGNRNLDKAALQHVLKTWRFKPAMQNGQVVQAYGLVPIAFSLQ
ncbi:TonB family protein [Pseudoxanthomonas sp.]|jgi:TonB family C-terminal domain|uniref:energy transducer TonB n=1 Tax=Pseudoxanthomonas sp. TaxID=1871049 RepID=UPI002FDFCE0B